MTALVVPQWTEQMYRPVSGQDHLGVGSVVTDRILPRLSPGINVITTRARYWSFYAFVLDEFWRRDLPRTNADLRQFLRRRESIFSAAGHVCQNPDHGDDPIGGRKVAPLVATNPQSYRADFDYVKSSGGGYGLYYATVMQSTGVVRLRDTSAGLPADTITPRVGVELAAAFRDSIAETEYWKRYFDADEVPAEVVAEYAEAACLCRLPTSPDREPVADVLLHGGGESAASARRTSLRMILEIADQTDGAEVESSDFRRLLLYRAAYESETDELTAEYEPSADLRSAARRWRLSQLREMFNWSLNGLWAWITQWGLAREGDIVPVQRSELSAALDAMRLRDLPGVRSKLSDPIGRLIDECRVLAAVTDSLDGQWELWTELTEDHLLRMLQSNELDENGELAALFVMYVMTLSRLWSADLPNTVSAEDWDPVLDGDRRRISLQLALQQLRHDAVTGRTVREVLERVVEQHVLAQHQRVALAKLPDDTYRYRREGDRLRFFDQPTAFRMNDSRFRALSTVCTELGWCGHLADPDHPLSEDGQSLLRNGDLPGDLFTLEAEHGE